MKNSLSGWQLLKFVAGKLLNLIFGIFWAWALSNFGAYKNFSIVFEIPLIHDNKEQWAF